MQEAEEVEEAKEAEEVMEAGALLPRTRMRD